MRRILPFSAVLLASFLAGCSTNEAPAEPAPPTPDPATLTTPAPATEAADPHAGHGHAPGEGHAEEATAPAAPFAGGGMATADAPLTPTPELDKAIKEAEKSNNKELTAEAYAARGTVRMNDDKAGAKVKYRAALADYRKALSLDPKNPEANTNKKMIEDIYKSMGRPIPGEEDSAAK